MVVVVLLVVVPLGSGADKVGWSSMSGSLSCDTTGAASDAASCVALSWLAASIALFDGAILNGDAVTWRFTKVCGDGRSVVPDRRQTGRAG